MDKDIFETSFKGILDIQPYLPFGHIFAYNRANTRTSVLKKSWLLPIMSLEKGSTLFTWVPNMHQEKKISSMVNFLIFMHKNGYRIGFQEIKIRPLEGFELGP